MFDRKPVSTRLLMMVLCICVFTTLDQQNGPGHILELYRGRWQIGRSSWLSSGSSPSWV